MSVQFFLFLLYFNIKDVKINLKIGEKYMKKKFLYGILFLVLMFTAFVPVKALDSDKLPTPAKNMTYSPKKGDRVYAIADTYAFDDFATNVKFTAKTGTDMITPKTGQGAKKILISLNPKFENALATSKWIKSNC